MERQVDRRNKEERKKWMGKPEYSIESEVSCAVLGFVLKNGTSETEKAQRVTRTKEDSKQDMKKKKKKNSSFHSI